MNCPTCGQELEKLDLGDWVGSFKVARFSDGRVQVAFGTASSCSYAYLSPESAHVLAHRLLAAVSKAESDA